MMKRNLYLVDIIEAEEDMRYSRAELSRANGGVSVISPPALLV